MDIKRPSLKQLARATATGLTVAWLASALVGCNKAPDATPPAATAPVADSAPVAVAPAPVATPVAAEPEEHHHHEHHEHHDNQMAAGSPPPVPNSSYGPPPPPPQVCGDCGTIAAINVVEVQGSDSGAGAVGGALAGGVLGHQAGKGKGKTAMTVLGALGGAFAGNMAEKAVRSSHQYNVVVQMDAGGTQTVKFTSQPPYGVGQHVRVDGGQLSGN